MFKISDISPWQEAKVNMILAAGFNQQFKVDVSMFQVFQRGFSQFKLNDLTCVETRIYLT